MSRPDIPKVKRQCSVCARGQLGDHDCDDFSWYVPEASIVSVPTWKDVSQRVQQTTGVDFSVVRVEIDGESINLKDTVGFGLRSDSLNREFRKYNIKINSLLRGGLSERELVSVVESKHVLVRHRELVQMVTLGPGQGAIEIRLTPGGNPMMPWLSRVSSQYKYYRIRGMIFDYVPKVSTKNLALVSTASFFGLTYSKRMSEHHCYLKSRACSRWVHPVECPRASKGHDFLIGHADPAPGYAGTLMISTEGKFPDHSELGELWVSYEVEFWGVPTELSPDDNIYSQLVLMSTRIGPEFGVARYLFARSGNKRTDRVSVDWVDDRGRSSKNTGVENLRVMVRDKRFPKTTFVLSRTLGLASRSVRQMALAALATVATKWKFVGKEVVSFNGNYNFIYLTIKDQVLLSIASTKSEEVDIIQGLASVGIIASSLTNYMCPDASAYDADNSILKGVYDAHCAEMSNDSPTLVFKEPEAVVFSPSEVVKPCDVSGIFYDPHDDDSLSICQGDLHDNVGQYFGVEDDKT